MPGNLYTEGYVRFLQGLRAVRVGLGVTQAVLAGRLGQPQSYVSKTERGERRLDVAEFVAWAIALEQEPEALLAHLRSEARL
jgi:transcriptional regulator with XRE-family HTH domain